MLWAGSHKLNVLLKSCVVAPKIILVLLGNLVSERQLLLNGLTQRIANGDVTETLEGKKVRVFFFLFLVYKLLLV